MALAEVDYLNGGGKNPEWIELPDSTTSPYNISAEWDYDADVLLILANIADKNHILMYDLSTGGFWLALSDGFWHYDGIDSRFTYTSRSMVGSWGYAAKNISIMPIIGKPTGYFT